MSTVRRPAVAGRFYPEDPEVLAAEVDALLAAAPLPPAGERPPAGLIVPHAGYRYSGPVAAAAHRRLVGRTDIATVVLLGPNHTVPLRAMAVTAAARWDTPLGSVPVDGERRSRLVALDDVVVDDGPHQREHALEVQLPFLQRALPAGFSILPVVVGQVPAASVAALVDAVWDRDVLLLVSTDLSHHHDQHTAVALDEDTVAAVLDGSVGHLDPRRACGWYPLEGLLEVVGRRQERIGLLDRRTSGDAAGDLESVVGYAAFTVGAR